MKNGAPDAKLDHSVAGSGSKVFWPRDLLPGQIHDVRILTYGYHVQSAASVGGDVLGLAQTFAQDLAVQEWPSRIGL